MSIEVKVENLPQVVAGLDTVAGFFGNMLEFAPIVAEEVYAQVERTINSGNEGTYPALAPSTVKEKEKKGQGGNPILVATGTMAAAATSSSATDSVYEPTENSLTIGLKGRSGVIASAHQWGTERLAARPIYVVTDLLKERIKERLLQFYGVKLEGFSVSIE